MTRVLDWLLDPLRFKKSIKAPRFEAREHVVSTGGSPYVYRSWKLRSRKGVGLIGVQYTRTFVNQVFVQRGLRLWAGERSWEICWSIL